MIKKLKKLVVFVFTAMVLLPCMPAFADTIEDVVWTTGKKTIILSDTSDGNYSAVGDAELNSIEVIFADAEAKYASYAVVPVTDGKPENITTENAVLISQQPVADGVSKLNFHFKPETEKGVYALIVGGTNTEYVTKYFCISDSFMPTLLPGKNFQYDDYKNGIDLSFDVSENVNFSNWVNEKNNMFVKISTNDKTAEINSDDIVFDVEKQTMFVNLSNYQNILPEFDTVIENNIQQATVSITTPGYVNEIDGKNTITGTVGLITPELSSKGFEGGVEFDITLYSENDLSDVYPIIAVYDGEILVHCFMGDKVSLLAGETKEIPIKFSRSGLKPSGKFSIQVMLWEDARMKPMTSYVVFP